jgi:EAL domain-containing protein (putative c-di-GMP-specific phosphodiesterase class I)
LELEPYSVNLSPTQVRNSDLAATVTRALSCSGLQAERLELDITEAALIDNAVHCATLLHQFKGLGVTIALDDFGTGYSSLSQLTNFPIDRIKIERSFTKNFTRSADCAAIISATMRLAYSLSIATTTEGVETKQQYRLLKWAGVSSVQGYLFSLPCRVSEIDFSASYGDQAVDTAA